MLTEVVPGVAVATAELFTTTSIAGLDGVRWLIPGHGHVGDAAEFRRRVDADRRYLNSPAAGDPRLDDGPPWLRQAHEDQVRLAGR